MDLKQGDMIEVEKSSQLSLQRESATSLRRNDG